MRAQTLTICVPNKGCDKNCPYCVSRMTGYTPSNTDLMSRNLKKVVTLAQSAQISSVLFTGKGEPFLNVEWLIGMARSFNIYPIEVQTNGIWLNENYNCAGGIETLKESFNVIAFSIDKMEDIEKYTPMFRRLDEEGIVVRVTLNISQLLEEGLCFHTIWHKCVTGRVKQLSFRNLTVPNGEIKDKETAEWVKENNNTKFYEILTKAATNGTLLRTLPFGAKVYDWNGLSVTAFDYCIQDRNCNEDIRSLIFEEDGHLYTSWNSKASILF